MSRSNGGRYGGRRPRSVAEMQPPIPNASDEDDSLTDDADQGEFEPEYTKRGGYGSGRFVRRGSGRSGYSAGYSEEGYRSQNYPEVVRYKNTYQPPSRHSGMSVAEERPKRRGAWGRCVSCLCCVWKVTRCLCSHITLVTIVVAYCVFGAFMFEKLEANNEKKVKQDIVNIRTNVTNFLWNHTSHVLYLDQTNWTDQAANTLKDFEAAILKAMKKDGWDGNEDVEKLQWSFFGALFYSIIVITTIGYGHIAPKTQMGKVATILYAIAGIPLMLLCLSNIGDVMAQCFRFLYWRVCCFVCTRDPQPKSKRRSRSRSASSRGTRQQYNAHHAVQMPAHRWSATGMGGGAGVSGGSTRSRKRAASMGMGTGRRFPSTRSADSAIQIDISRSYSDTECRFARRNAFDDGDQFHYPTASRQNDPNKFSSPYRSQDRNSGGAGGGPVLSNKYALDRDESFKIRRQQLRAQSVGREPRKPVYPKPGGSLPRHYRLRERNTSMNQPPPQHAPYESARSRYSYGSGYPGGRRYDQPSLRTPSPRIMSPMGYGMNRQYYVSQEYDSWDVEMDEVSPHPNHTRPVPIWLCIFLVVSYIIGGAFLFHQWEDWGYLDSAYFCFITLTTIGFGDFVPASTANATASKENAKESLALCSLYLLFGISLLAMSFNLVQEEVLSSVRSVARRLGIIKSNSDDY